MSVIMVTGVNGFVGAHLVRVLKQLDHEVIGVGREDFADSTGTPGLKKYIQCDLADKGAVSKLKLNNVDAIINLAGLASVGPSFDNPILYMRTNPGILENILGLISLKRLPIRVVAISTGAVYASNQELPLGEDAETDENTSPYAASKLAMEKVAAKFIKAGQDCVIARPFNHIGPGQTNGFLLPDLVREIKTTRNNQIKTGNLKTRRDYTDVRDVVKAYVSLATQKRLQNNVYNVCSGKPVSGEEILDLAKKACGRTDIKTVVNKKLLRPSDNPVIYGDNSKLMRDTGWCPIIPIQQTVSDFVANWKP